VRDAVIDAARQESEGAAREDAGIWLRMAFSPGLFHGILCVIRNVRALNLGVDGRACGLAAASVLEDFWGSRALKKLLVKCKGGDRQAEEACKVAARLWESALKGQCKQLAGSHAAKVMLTLPWATAHNCSHGQQLSPPFNEPGSRKGNQTCTCV
jgi:hypothetical protein